MDSEELYNRELADRARNFERLLASGESFFYDTDELEEIIDYYLDEEEYVKAMNAIQYGQSLFPFESYYVLKNAEVLIAKRDSKSAISLLEELKQKEPNNAEVFKLLGDAYFSNMQLRRSVDFYHAALTDPEYQEELIIKLAKIHFMLNKPKKALSYLGAFPEDFLFDDILIPELVKLFYDHGYTAKAVPFLQKIIDNTPYNYSAWYFLGYTYQKMEEYEKALSAFDYATLIDESNNIGYLGKGTALMDLGKYDEANENFAQAFDGSISDAEILCNMAECYENMNEIDNAQFAYLKAIKVDENLSDAYYGLGMVYKKKGQLKVSVDMVHKAIDLDPFESLYHIELAELYLTLNKVDLAIRHYLKGIEIDPETPEIVLDLAQAYVEKDEVEEAIEALIRHFKNFPDDYRFLYRIASYEFQAGNYQSGYEYLHKALQEKPEEYPLLYEYAPFLENNDTITNIIDLYHS